VSLFAFQQLALFQQKSLELVKLQREIEQLRKATNTFEQVLVKVQMLEVNLTKLRKLGMDFDRFTDGSITNAGPRQMIDALVAPVSSPIFDQSATVDANASSRLVDALKQNSLAKVLAEPNVVVTSGRPGSFNVGGELPLPAKDGIEFRKFGTQLDLLAVALGDNQIRLEIRTRVSEIDEAHAIEINGARIPGLSVREVDTAYEMSFGQSAILTGLVQKRTEAIKLDSGEIKQEQVEFGLLVVVTPELVDSMDMPAADASRDDRRTKK
jgi:pilus assembly protein CpaC